MTFTRASSRSDTIAYRGPKHKGLAMIRFSCPTCKNLLQAAPEQAGATVACPKCKTQMKVPVSPPKVPSAQNRPLSTSSPAPMPRAVPPIQATPKTASGNPPPLPVSVQASGHKAVWWKRLLHEIREIGVATWGLPCRCAHYAWEGWRGRSKRRAFADAQIALGEHINERKSGDHQLQVKIAALDENIRQAEAAKKSTSAFKAERRSLILALAAPALSSQTALPGTEPEHQRAKVSKAAVESHEERMESARSSLPPKDGAGWRRIGIGYGSAACFCFLALVLLTLAAGRSSRPTGVAADSGGKNSNPKQGDSTTSKASDTPGTAAR